MDARRLDDYLNTLACRRAACIVCIIAPVSGIHTLYGETRWTSEHRAHVHARHSDATQRTRLNPLALYYVPSLL